MLAYPAPGPDHVEQTIGTTTITHRGFSANG